MVHSKRVLRVSVRAVPPFFWDMVDFYITLGDNPSVGQRALGAMAGSCFGHLMFANAK
jgi:hypothetical protein